MIIETLAFTGLHIVGSVYIALFFTTTIRLILEEYRK